jgi:hypothetical protein
MKKPIIPALALTILQNTASAAPGTATEPTALALAAVIAQHSPAVRAFDKRVIARLFRGNTSPNTKICVDADSAVCRVTDVDITSRSCDLSFGSLKTHADRARSQRTCRRSLRGSEPKASRSCGTRSIRTRSCGRRRRGDLHLRRIAVDVFAHSKRG